MKTEIVTIENRLPALNGGLDMIKQNLAPGEVLETKDFQRISWPGGGGTRFDTESGNVTGVVIAHRIVREMFPRDFNESGGQDRPYCTSPNGEIGYCDTDSNTPVRKEIAERGKPDGNCRQCVFSKFHTIGGRNVMLCNERREVIMIAEGFTMPVRLSIPPSSTRIFRQYLINLGMPLNTVVTRVSLQKAQNKAGIKYAQAVFDAEQLEAKDAERVIEFSKNFIALL